MLIYVYTHLDDYGVWSSEVIDFDEAQAMYVGDLLSVDVGSVLFLDDDFGSHRAIAVVEVPLTSTRSKQPVSEPVGAA